jgi:hypothetical protein
LTKNLTLAIDEDLLKKARKIAIDRNTTVTGLIRKYLLHLVNQQDINKIEVVSELESIFNQSQAVIGDITWSRDDLYAR